MSRVETFLNQVKKDISELKRNQDITADIFRCIEFFRHIKDDKIVYSYRHCFPNDPTLKTDVNSIINNASITAGFEGTTHLYDPAEYEF